MKRSIFGVLLGCIAPSAGFSEPHHVLDRYLVIGSIGDFTESETGETSVAVIYDQQRKRTLTLRPGEFLAANLQLMRVFERRVIVAEGKQEYSLYYKKEDPGASGENLAVEEGAEPDGADPVVTIVDAWGRQTEVSLDEYLSGEEQMEGDDIEIAGESVKVNVPPTMRETSSQPEMLGGVASSQSSFPQLSYGISRSGIAQSLLIPPIKADNGTEGTHEDPAYEIDNPGE